ncbi:hypothetical protein DQ237_07245 [Blastococcus sp. TF02-8]|nr:hypothetical protein DQ237_07245 [Blastococcus sp. TF02-8]
MGYLAAQLAQLIVLHRLVPRFFWLDDSQAQFGPMAWWLGRNLDNGIPPLVDPGQGASGNVTSDMQYGVLDPLHWLLWGVLGRQDNVLTMAWEYGATCVILLGLGVLALLRRHGVPGFVATAGALGVASSGFFLWYGSFWWPLMWGSAWLPWLWLGLSSRRPRGLLLTGLATWAVLASGSPYTIPFALVIVIAQAFEMRREAGGLRPLVHSRAFLGQFGALVAGVLVAMPTLLNAVQQSSYVERQSADEVIGNTGGQVPNLLDVLVGGPTLLGQTNAFNGAVGLVPAMATFLLGLPLVAMVRWRAAFSAPGLVTAGALALAGVIATQLPTVVGLFRYPFRYLVVVQIALPVLVLLGLAVAGTVTRRRVAVATGLVGVQLALAISRAPLLWPWHVAGAVVVAVALIAFLVSRSRVDRVGVLAAVVLVVLTAVPLVLAEKMMVVVQDRLNIERGFTGAAGQPYRDIGVPDQSGAGAMGQTVREFRDRSILTDRTATVYAWGFFGDVFGSDRGWAKGFFPGNANLLAGATVGTGYVTSPHKGLAPILCTSYVGNVDCPSPTRLLNRVPGTDLPWIEALSSDTVALSRSVPEELRSYFDRRWEQVDGDGEWQTYRRPEEMRLPGRIAALDGVEVAREGWSVGLGRIDQPQEEYTVTTSGQSEGTVLLRVPYWPGYRATIDGEEVPVTAVDDALVEVTVPAGVRDGRLALTFDPIGAQLLYPSLAAGAGLMILTVTLAMLAVRRSPRGDDAIAHDGERVHVR